MFSRRWVRGRPAAGGRGLEALVACRMLTRGSSGRILARGTRPHIHLSTIRRSVDYEGFVLQILGGHVMPGGNVFKLMAGVRATRGGRQERRGSGGVSDAGSRRPHQTPAVDQIEIAT